MTSTSCRKSVSGFNLRTLLAVCAMTAAMGSSCCFAGTASVPQAATQPQAEGWQDIDQRLVFLTVQLSSAEASLNAVNRAILLTGDQQTAKKQAADQYRKGNELMDRKGGGPASWSEFYGRTAEKFFYHPTGRNSSYHTIVILRPGQSDAADGTANHNTALTNRPPQFDYIYRANTEAQRQAETDIAQLGSKIETLRQRQRQLENEQSLLWCRITFRGALSKGLMDDPLYQFDLKVANDTGRAAQQREALLACIEFMRSSYRLIALADAAKNLDQGLFYNQLETATGDARNRLSERLIQLDQFAGELNDTHQTLGKYVALSKRSRDVAKNIADAYRLAADGDQSGDRQRENTFRGMLQESLVMYSELVLAEDECIRQMGSEWSIGANFSLPLAESERRTEPLATAIAAVSHPAAVVQNARPQMPIMTPVDEPATQTASTPTARAPQTPYSTRVRANAGRTPSALSRDIPDLTLTHEPKNILSTLTDRLGLIDSSPAVTGPVVLLSPRSGPGRCGTANKFSPPARFRFEAKTEKNNIRFRFGSRFIFNWEMGNDELRVDFGPLSGKHKKGAGYVRPDAWHNFDLVVLPGSLKLIVDGEERYSALADFSAIHEPLTFETNDSAINIRALTVSLP